jgi:hypothetical protein
MDIEPHRLDSDDAFNIGVFGLIDHPHRAATQLREDFVAADLLDFLAHAVQFGPCAKRGRQAGRIASRDCRKVTASGTTRQSG